MSSGVDFLLGFVGFCWMAILNILNDLEIIAIY